MLNKSLPGPVLTGAGLWTLRIALVAWLMNVENPFGVAGAVLVLTAQFPIQRAVLAWDRASRAAGRQTGRQTGR